MGMYLKFPAKCTESGFGDYLFCRVLFSEPNPIYSEKVLTSA